jgi:hypothetical protein
MSVQEQHLTMLLTRAAEERPVDPDALWARTLDRLGAAERVAIPEVRPSGSGRRRLVVIAAAVTTAVIAGSTVLGHELGDSASTGVSTVPVPSLSPRTAQPGSLADGVLHVSGVRLPPSQRHVQATVRQDSHLEDVFSGPVVGLERVTVTGQTGVLVLVPGTHRRDGTPFGRFVGLTFVGAGQTVSAAIRSQAYSMSSYALPTSPDAARANESWGFDDQPEEQTFAGRVVLTASTGPSVRRWMVDFTDGSSAAAQRFAVPGGGGSFFILVGPAGTTGKTFAGVRWLGRGGTVLDQADASVGLP